MLLPLQTMLPPFKLSSSRSKEPVPFAKAFHGASTRLDVITSLSRFELPLWGIRNRNVPRGSSSFGPFKANRLIGWLHVDER